MALICMCFGLFIHVFVLDGWPLFSNPPLIKFFDSEKNKNKQKLKVSDSIHIEFIFLNHHIT